MWQINTADNKPSHNHVNLSDQVLIKVNPDWVFLAHYRPWKNDWVVFNDMSDKEMEFEDSQVVKWCAIPADD